MNKSEIDVRLTVHILYWYSQKQKTKNKFENIFPTYNCECPAGMNVAVDLIPAPTNKFVLAI